MEKTARTFPKLKKIYNKFFRFKLLDVLINMLMNAYASFLAKNNNFYFPTKFNWDMKLEMLTKKYERETTILFNKIIKPGMVIIDIGAHIGYYTTLFSKLTGADGKIYAFEADIDNFKLLKKNINKYKNINIYNIAIADKNGRIDFYKVKNSTGCHSIIKANNAVKTSVQATTLDNFMVENNINQIDIIKIDIEGAEPLAFQGMKKLFNKNKNLSIVMEFSPDSFNENQPDPAEFLNNLNKQGFKIFQIIKNGKTLPFSGKNIAELKLNKEGSINLLLKKNADLI